MVVVIILIFYARPLLAHYTLFIPKGGLNSHIMETRIKRVPNNVKWLADLTDKHKVKGLVAALGVADLEFPVTYAVGRYCKDIPWDELPQNFVLKPTHSSGVFHILRLVQTLVRSAERMLVGRFKALTTHRGSE